MGSLAGKQFIGRHTTATVFTKKLCREICKAFPACTISLGVIENLRGKIRSDATWTLKIYEDSGCIRIICLQKASKQTFRIYGCDQASVEKLLQSLSVKNHWRLR